MSYRIINKTGNADALLEDLKSVYNFLRVTEDDKAYITDDIYLEVRASGSNRVLYAVKEDTATAFTNGTVSNYCIAVTDNGVGFGTSVNTITTFIGTTTDSSGRKSAGIVGSASSSSHTIMSDESTDLSTIPAPRSNKTSSLSQMQVFPVAAWSGTEVFDDIMWVFMANQSATAWKLSDVEIKGERFLAGVYLAMRYTE